MEHLNSETLARLVDNAPAPEQATHLAECDICTSELVAFREQTEALGSLPEILPPMGDWQVLEARLRSEGLVEDAGMFQRLGLARTPAWMRAAAAAVLFLGGTAMGAAMTSGTSQGLPGGIGSGTDVALFASGGTTVEDAAQAVRVAERTYMNAIARLREQMRIESGLESGVDPMRRYAALEHLVAVSQAAVRQAPGDPYLNGILASVLGEREATARMVSRTDNWF